MTCTFRQLIVFYGCSFVAKLSWKKISFWKNICAFDKIYITLLAEKNVFIWKKSFILRNFFTEKNCFYREKINENVKNIYLI